MTPRAAHNGRVARFTDDSHAKARQKCGRIERASRRHVGEGFRKRGLFDLYALYNQPYMKNAPSNWQQAISVFWFYDNGYFHEATIKVFHHKFVGPTTGKIYDGKKLWKPLRVSEQYSCNHPLHKRIVESNLGS